MIHKLGKRARKMADQLCIFLCESVWWIVNA